MGRDDETITDAGPLKGQAAPAPDPSSEGAGPTSPGHPDPAPERGPPSGGYDRREPVPAPDNARGGYGAG